MRRMRAIVAHASGQAIPDNSVPTEERKSQLSQAIAENNASGRPPYDCVRVLTRGELLWATAVAVDLVPGAVTYRDRIDLRGVNLQGAILADIQFPDADLQGADLRQADLRGANLRGANLNGATLWHADFRGADISDSEMGQQTNIKNLKIDAGTLLGDIKWNDVNVTRVDWGAAPFLGDEEDIYRKQSRVEYIKACQYAARAYRSLSIVLRSQGIVAMASRYRLRQQQLERYVALAEGKLASWLGSFILDAVSGYGERPGRIFVTYMCVVTLFSAIYWAISNLVIGTPTRLAWYEALVLSLSSFHGRGFFPASISLGDPIAMVAAAEAVIGLFIELILIATFSRRFLSD